MPRSGSTLLELMLGQLPQHCDIGELFYMWSGGVLRDQRCACGERFSQCPFWTEVGRRAFGGWDAELAREVMSLQERVDRTPRLLLRGLGPLLPGHRRAVDRYLSLIRRVYGAVADVSGAEVVVDSTKRPSTAFLLAGDPQIELRVAHVVRDPRGVLNSWSREVALPEKAGPRSHLKARPTRQVLRRWLTVNLMFEWLARRGVPTERIRYEDIAAAPVEVMTRMMSLSSSSFASSPSSTDPEKALSFLQPDGTIESVHSHAATGGRVRFTGGPIRLRLDEAWRTELPDRKQRITRAICGPLMRRYGYR
jgi:hypothetical protein